MACLASDGLRTLLHTSAAEVPKIFEKTLRYPEHVNQMRIFNDAGFFSQTPIQVGGVSVRPIDVTASVLTPLWKYKPGESDLTVMRLVISGTEDGKPETYTYDMYDEYDPATRTPSMARTTGYTCTAVVRLILGGDYSQTGIIAPEILGRFKGCRKSVQNYLAERDVHYVMQRS
jgi:saccharopine dehydrogenase-like NADP-dependent oxidoreductase